MTIYNATDHGFSAAGQLPSAGPAHDQLPRYGVLARRTPGSMMGPDASWVQGEDRSPMTFSSLREARDEARLLNAEEGRSPSVKYEGARIGRTS